MTNTAAGGDRPTLMIRCPEDAICAVPYLLGFHPELSIVAIGTEGPSGTCAMRLDLPAATGPPAGVASAAARALGEHIAALMLGNRFTKVLLLGYGPEERVTPTIEAACAALRGHPLEVGEALRVEGGRWWSYHCRDPRCCPPEGSTFDIAGSVIAAQATLAGQVAHADRAELARTVAPVGGPARSCMRRATDRAEERFFGWAVGGMGPGAVGARMVEEGLPMVADLAERVRAGAVPPDDDEIAWLGVLLTSLRVRDEAWIRIDGAHLEGHVGFWRDVLRRVEDPYAAAPGSLLAYAAYASGDGGLANVALDRVFEADPGYSMASLVRDLIIAGVPPRKARLDMTPHELAAAYGDHDAVGEAEEETLGRASRVALDGQDRWDGGSEQDGGDGRSEQGRPL